MASKFEPEEVFFNVLASKTEAAHADLATPSRLKSRVYSALIRCQQESGPLLSVTDTKASGAVLCAFEELVRIAPVGEKAKAFNCCSICHARWVAEKVEGAPIYWSGCPYVGFQNR